jgi:ribosomal-protein-serine acetyltransferase
VVQRLPEGTEEEGVVIRRWRMDDAVALHEAITANVEHLRPRMAWIAQEPLALDDRRDLIDRWDGEWADGGDVLYGVWEHDVVVASCGLHRRLGPGGLEIGYWTHVDHQGRGIATTLSRLLTDLAFTLDEVDRVEIHQPHQRGQRPHPREAGLPANRRTEGDERAAPCRCRHRRDLAGHACRVVWLTGSRDLRPTAWGACP